MNVLVVGGSGFIGTNLCRELSSRDHDVTVLSRDPGSESLPDGVDAAMGDVTAYDSIVDAFEGRDAVYNLVSPSPLFESGIASLMSLPHGCGSDNRTFLLLAGTLWIREACPLICFGRGGKRRL